MPAPLRIGLAGLGTVGSGVIRMLQTHGETIATRAGRPIEISAVSARSRHRDRGVDLSAYDWEDDPVALARRADVDLVVEVIGGEDGPARATATAAIAGGKHVVTANKALLAVHGTEIFAAAQAKGVDVIGVTDHTIFQSIYFRDPSGHRLELAADTATPKMNQMLDEVKWDMLNEWDRTKKAPTHARWMHDGSYAN